MTTIATRAIVEGTIPDSAAAANRPTEVPPFDLKAARERAGLSLARIAGQTKIPLSLLEGLERGDLRHCPPGIYARAYVRAYAQAVHLPVDAVFATVRGCLPAEEESLEQLRRAKAAAGERRLWSDQGLRAIWSGGALLVAIVTIVWAAGPRVSSTEAERGPSQTPAPAAPTVAPRIVDKPVAIADARPQVQQHGVGGSPPRPRTERSRRVELPSRQSGRDRQPSDEPPPGQARVEAVRVASAPAPDPLPAKVLDVPVITVPQARLSTSAVAASEQQPRLQKAFKTVGHGLRILIRRSAK